MGAAANHTVGTEVAAHAMASVSGPSDGGSGTSIPFSLHYVAGEVTAAALVVGAWAQALTPIATLVVTLLASAWYVIMIVESRTVARLKAARKRVDDEAEVARAKVLDTAVDAAKQLKDEVND